MRGLIVVALSCAVGAFAGWRLARVGVTAANALRGRQLAAYVALAVVSGAGFIFYFAPTLRWVPSYAAVMGEQIVMDGSRALAAFALGFVALLEWPGRRDPVRRRQLALATGLLAFGTGFLTYRSLPISVGAPGRVDGAVVLQTTPYTCAPATIATLLRWVGADTGATEEAIVALARTTREGTTTRTEVDVLRRLGLEPRYARFLVPESLAVMDRPALLHVNEPVASGVTIRHAVALLAVDRQAQSVLIGNPLHGRQVKRFSDLPGYWTGEAIFIARGGRARASWHAAVYFEP